MIPRTTFLDDAAEIVGGELGIAAETITAARKGPPAVAFARQVLAYLLHTEAQLDKQQVGRLLRRHRSTIGHAIEVVEEQRDVGVMAATLELIAGKVRAICPRPAPTVPMPSVKLSDGFVRTLTAALTEGGLLDDLDSVDLDRSDDAMTVRVMLRARGILAQTGETDRAGLTRTVLIELARVEGWSLRFADALWCERGVKGWRVIGKFRRQSAPS